MSLSVPTGRGREWTAEQAEAIARRDGELLLAAGAGSGKTSVLVERFVAHVLEDEIPLTAILAITFTEKAAAELRERIRVRLHELGAFEAARATESAFISTIHGFCARVLRAGALAAGLDPGFVVLDRDRSETLARVAFDAALQEMADGGAVELVAAFGAGPLRHAITSVYDRLRSSGQSRPELPPVGPPPGPRAGETLLRASDALAAELAGLDSPGPSVLEALRRLERCRELVGTEDLWPAELGSVRLPGNGSALSTDACTAYKEALATYRAAVAARVAAPVRDLMDSLLRLFGERYREAKRSVSGVDFEDLELLSLELLKARPELRERYAERFERIMVDEQQDTNRVQMELIETVARANLFTVGDAQQSIYRFRHADVALFEKRAESLARVGQRLALQTNFRSAPEILEPLNAAFTNALGERFTALTPGRASAEAKPDEPLVELLLVDKGAEWELEGLAAPWRLAEARALADRVAELAAEGTAPGEIVVLMRATSDLRAYERALEGRGLPTYVIGGRGYWSHPQVLDLVAYLSIVANPRDEEALYAVLASPMVGVSFDALVVLAGAARTRRTDPWTVLQDGEELAELDRSDRESSRDFAAWFAAERALAARLSVEELIDRALELTGYDVAMLAMPGGRRRMANVRKLMRLGREYEAEHGPDLRGFLDTIAERAAGRAVDARESEAPVEGDGLDAIRLMTIHRAKGLEWPVVCVADLGRSPRPPHQILRVGSGGRLGLRLSRPGVGGRVSALDYEALGEEEKQADEDEERRLFYVAMTRARERLILSGATRFDGWTGAANATGGGPVAWIAPAFVPELGRLITEGGGVVSPGAGQLRVRIIGPESLLEAATNDPEPTSAAAPTSARPEPGREPLPMGPPGPPVATLSYSALGEYARCGYRFYAERVLRLPPTDERPAPGATAHGLQRTAAERGVLLHAMLERLDFRRPVVSDPRAAAQAAGIAVPSADEATQLAALVSRFAASPLCARLARAAEARREERFAFTSRGDLLITGAIDVLAREPDGGTLIVDYKSDHLAGADPEVLVAHSYAIQRVVYGLAALHAGAARVEIVHTFLERPEAPVTVVYTAEDRGALETELARHADGISRRQFPVAAEPHRGLCAGCPAEGGLCSWPMAMTRREATDRLF